MLILIFLLECINRKPRYSSEAVHYYRSLLCIGFFVNTFYSIKASSQIKPPILELLGCIMVWTVKEIFRNFPISKIKNIFFTVCDKPMLEGETLTTIEGAGTPGPDGKVLLPLDEDTSSVLVEFSTPPEEITKVQVTPPTWNSAR